MKNLFFGSFENLFQFKFLQETEEIFIATFCDLYIIDYSKSFKKSKKITIKDFAPSNRVNVDISYYSQIEEFNIEGDKVSFKNGITTGIIPATLKRLHLTNVHGISGLAGFEHLRKISLFNYPNITTLRGLERVPIIHLNGFVAS